MKVLINYSPALGKEIPATLEFQNVGEYKSLPVDDAEKWARVKIIKVTSEPTATRTGSAIYRVEYSNGSYHEDIGVICKPRGGARPGAGRPSIGNSKAVSLRICEEAGNILSQQPNKNAFVSEAILYYQAHKAE